MSDQNVLYLAMVVVALSIIAMVCMWGDPPEGTP